MNNKTNIKTRKTALKWDVNKRMMLLESTVYWCGGLRTTSLVKTFGISRVQASKDLSLYREMCPDNIRYDKHQKRYLATEQFLPKFCEGTVSEYLDMIQASHENEKFPVVSLIDNAPHVAVVKPAMRSFSAKTLQNINHAIIRGEEMEIVYRTMSRLKTIKHLLCPHTLIFDGLNWHLRAYSYNHEDYKNFLLVRILEAKILGKADVNLLGDKEWHTHVNIRLGLNPGLTKLQKSVLESDYGMENGTLSYKIRAALIPFFLNAMHIKMNDIESDPLNNPVVLLNRTEIDRYLAA